VLSLAANSLDWRDAFGGVRYRAAPMTASGVDPVRSGRSIIFAPMPCKQTLAGYRMAFIVVPRPSRIAASLRTVSA